MQNGMQDKRERLMHAAVAQLCGTHTYTHTYIHTHTHTLLGPPNGTIELQERISRSSCATLDPTVFDINFLTESEWLNWKCNQKLNKCTVRNKTVLRN